MAKKIVWLSNSPFVPTGYGTQSAQVGERLIDAGYDLAFVGFYGLEGALGTWHGATIYPTDHTRLGKYMLPEYVKDHARGEPIEDVLVMTLMDLWVMTDPRWGGLARTNGLKMASWMPIDHYPVPPKTMQALEVTGSHPIAMSKFGRDALAEMEIKADYVPHAVDTNIFRPHPRQKDMILKGISNDVFVVGMVANNQGNAPPRKAFPQVFQAFAEFQSRHEDVFLYLHTDVLGLNEGINLLALANICGIPNNKIGAVDQFKYHIGAVTPEIMARVYSSFDVLAMPSYGEGFGIPLIEAQACGCPVITTDWTAMPELVKSGWKIQGDRWYDSSQGSFYMCPAVYEIVDALEEAYEARNDQGVRDQAVEGMKEYDADYVFENYWLPTMENIESRTKVAVPNRAMRRKKVKA